jgi:predicted transcriptional regulator YdeE
VLVLAAECACRSGEPGFTKRAPEEPMAGPNFERYDEKFDPVTGNGGLEIWVLIKS